MTQTGGLDVLIAWCAFGILLLALAWLVLRHHADPRAKAREKTAGQPEQHPDERT